MSTITRTYTFTDGTTAYGSQVESEIGNIVTIFNNHDSASSSWTTVSSTGIIQTTVSSATAIYAHAAYSGGQLGVFVDNTSNTASSSANVNVRVAGSSAGDAFYVANVIGGGAWAWGVDNSDSDSFKISNDTGLGAIDRITITTTASVVLGSGALLTTATDGFLYIASCAGNPAGIATAFAGRVAMVYDTSNNKIAVYNSGWVKTAALS